MKAVISSLDIERFPQAQTLADLGQNLTLIETPKPQPDMGSVLIQVEAFGVNRADLIQAIGKYPPPAGASHILGLECSGTIRQVGLGVDPSWLGRPVCALLDGGAYAEYVCVPVEYLLPLPEFPKGAFISEVAGGEASTSVSSATFGSKSALARVPVDRFVAGAALPEAALTSWSNLVEVAGLQPGQRVLITGASGGVGSFAVQMCAALGAEVYATAGSKQRCEQVKALGAKQVFDYSEDVLAAAKEANSGKGFDLIFDVVGAADLDQNLRLLATGGTLVIIGTLRGSRGELDIARLMGKRARIIGTTLRARPKPEKRDFIISATKNLFPKIAEGKILPVLAASEMNSQTETKPAKNAGALTFASATHQQVLELGLDREEPLTLAALAHHLLVGKTSKGAQRPFGKLVIRL